MISTYLLTACLSAARLTPAAAAAQLGDPAARVQLDAHGQLRFAQGSLGYLGAKPELVQQYLRSHAELFALRPDEQLTIHSDQLEPTGLRHLRISRTVAGVPVEFDQIRLHAAPTGLVYAVETELSPLENFTYHAPSMTPWQAIKKAEGGFKGKTLDPSHAELVVLGESLDGVQGAHLAYRVHVAFPARPGKVPVVEDQYIDANTGKVLAHLSRVYTADSPAQMTVSTLDGTATVNVDDFGAQGVLLKDVSLPNGPQIFTVNAEAGGSIYATTDTNTDFQDRISGEAGSVANNVSLARGFFESEFGWNRWDFGQDPAGSGGLLAGFAHEGQNLANAYFVSLTSNGQVFGTMHYGDGDGQYLTNTAKCLDVTGHEMGHGVVQGTAALVYHNQSGALNEHFADVFGWIFKQRQNQPNPDLIGDQCVGSALQPALRDMCNPTQVVDAQPDNMANYVNSPDTDDGDHGGVHTNSGIPNKAACLARNGSSLGKVGAIWFKALHDHLSSTSGFQDMVNATMTACSELSGTTTQSDCDALAGAWQAVGLAAASSGGNCPANSTASGSGCVCNSGFQPDASGNCVAIPTQQCPQNATFDAASGYCYCNAGYEPSPDGTSCSAVATGGCGANSHLEGGSCVCDLCYVFGNDPNHPGQETSACVADPNCNASCNDPGSINNATCDCIPGLSKDANGKCTVPAGSCGQETFAGRCDGNVLIYCFTTAAGNTNGDQVVIYDCSANGNTCGPDTTNGGYNCVAPAACPGNVPDTGVCGQGNTSAQYCSSGTVQSVNCGGANCTTFTYSGYQFNFCNPCDTGLVPAAGDIALPDGGLNCVSSAVGTSGGTSGGTGTTGSPGSGGDSGKSGCTSTDNAASLFAILTLVGLVAARRRR